ncbi:hypothetical protein [Methylobacterium oryzihabitans]|uniref:Uncharacterized protein n=1 Tax=Methylobacterium oryzihabitans TaxID=2499852 RepID=A0A3S2VUX9_9HYPH|nr:hypothetical protein [Methylobacterium oryzihabitans]RVU18148.1 hypothetical protein EOE48_12240 [Methylobacterium oryzihabitans]
MTLGQPIDRHLARLLAVAIVLIAAVLAPSAVWAHQGHLHGAGHGHHGTVRQAVPAGAVQSHAELARVDAAVVSAVLQAPAEPATERAAATCTGLCCGVACCVSAILPAATLVPPPAAGRRVARLAGPLARPGLGPDALREPPRPVLA